MLFAAGHGFRDETGGKFYLVTRETQRLSLGATALGWDEIAAAFDDTKARVIVFLDACHGGAAGLEGSNDDVVSSLIKRGSSITVIAASKGRQESLEFNSGGAFTTELVRAVSTERERTDANRNGAIELAELYGVIKQQVVLATQGRQTPWIARNQMVGEIPLF